MWGENVIDSKKILFPALGYVVGTYPLYYDYCDIVFKINLYYYLILEELTYYFMLNCDYLLEN